MFPRQIRNWLNPYLKVSLSKTNKQKEPLSLYQRERSNKSVYVYAFNSQLQGVLNRHCSAKRKRFHLTLDGSRDAPCLRQQKCGILGLVCVHVDVAISFNKYQSHKCD